MFLVFSQLPGQVPPFADLAARAARFFASKLELLKQEENTFEVLLQNHAVDGTFTLVTRAATRDDLVWAREAEIRGRAYGMADLAARCPRVWQLSVSAMRSPAATAENSAALTLCAICASVALGPVLPPDHSTLFGVRGAIERRDGLR